MVVGPPRERALWLDPGVAWSPPFLAGAGAMLVSPHDRRVEPHVFVVGVGGQQLENTSGNAALRPSAKALMDDLVVAGARREIGSWNARAIAVEDGLDEQPIVSRRAADMALAARQPILDPIPLIIAECVASHRPAPTNRPPMKHSSADLGVLELKVSSSTGTTLSPLKR